MLSQITQRTHLNIDATRKADTINSFLRRNLGLNQSEEQAVLKGRGIITEQDIENFENDSIIGKYVKWLKYFRQSSG